MTEEELQEQRKRRLRRALLVIATPLALLLAVDIVVRSSGFQRWVTGEIARLASELTGEDVSLAAVELSLWPLAAEVEGLSIRHHDSGATIAALKHGAVGVSFESWKPRLGVVSLDHPLVHLHIRDGKLDAFEALQGGEQQESSGPIELPWERLVVRGGTLELEVHGATEVGVRVAGLDVTPKGAELADIQLQALEVRVDDFQQSARPLLLAGVTLSGDRVVVPDLHIAFPALDVSGRVATMLGQDVSAVLTASAVPSEFAPLLPESIQIDGEVLADLDLGGTWEAPRLEAALLVDTTVSVEQEASSLYFAPGPLSGLVIADVDGLELAPVRLPLDDGELAVRGRMGWDLAVEELHVSGRDVPFAELMRRVGQAPTPWVDFTADLEAGLRGSLDPLELRGAIELATADLAVGSGPLGHRGTEVMLALGSGYVDGRLELDQDGVRLAVPRLAAGRTRGSLDLDVAFDGPAMDLALDLDRADLSDFGPLGGADLAGHGRVHGRIHGPFTALQVAMEADVQDLSALGFAWADRAVGPIDSDMSRVDFPGLHLFKGDTLVQGNLAMIFGEALEIEADLLVPEGGRVTDLIAIVADVPDLDGDVEGTISLAGPGDALTGSVDLQLSMIELFGLRFADGHLHGVMNEGRFTLQELVATRRGGAESLAMRGSMSPELELNFEVQTDGLDLARLELLEDADLPLTGSLSLDARVDGTIEAPQPHGRLALGAVELQGETLGSGEVFFDTSGSRMSWQGTLMDGAVAAWGHQDLDRELAWSVNVLADEVPLHRLRPLAEDGSPIFAVASGEGTLEGSWEGDAPVHADAIVSSLELRWRDHHLKNPAPWHLKQRGTFLELRDVALEDEHSHLDVTLTRTTWGEVTLSGGGELEAALLPAFVPGVRLAEGEIVIELSGSGSRGEGLEPQVELTLKDLNLRTDYFPHPLEEVSGMVEATEDVFEFSRPIVARLGGGEARLSGRIEAEGWIPTTYDLAIEATDARVQMFDYLPPAVGNATMTFTGSERLLLEGDIEITEMVFSERLDWERDVLAIGESILVDAGELTGEPFFYMDLGVTADDTIRMRNNVAQASFDIDLHVTGSDARPGMLGEIRMNEGGRVFMQNREFDVVRADLRYLEPWSFDPDLDILVKSDVESRDEVYEVRYRVSGPFSGWETEQSASPSLSQADINALVLYGVTTEELERQGAGATISAIAGAGFSVFIGKEVDAGAALDLLGALRPDRVDIVSGTSQHSDADWRLEMVKDLDEIDTELKAEIDLTNSNDSYVSAERQIGKYVYIEGGWGSDAARGLGGAGALGVDLSLKWEID